MAYYLFQAAYTPEAAKSLIKKPEDRAKTVRTTVERLGGKMHGFWFAFGDYDTVLILELPDNVTAGAFSLAVSAGGALRAAKTTSLLTVTEGLAAFKRAARAAYRPPGKPGPVRSSV
jgi:uncharacterized protein with GYD domain